MHFENYYAQLNLKKKKKAIQVFQHFGSVGKGKQTSFSKALLKVSLNSHALILDVFGVQDTVGSTINNQTEIHIQCIQCIK